MFSRLVKPVAAVAVLAGFAVGAPRAAAGIVLDDFSNPSPGTIYQIALLNSNPYKAPTTTVGTGIARDVTVTVVAPLPPNFNGVSGTIGGGTFTMDTDNATAAKSEITYSLTGAAKNLSLATAIDMAFLNLNPGNTSTGIATSMPAKIDIVTATGTLSWTGTIGGSATPFTKSVNLSAFTGSGGLGSVNSIKFTLNNGGVPPNVAADFALDKISVKVVPAPPAFVLAGIGALVLVGRSRLPRKPSAA